jgi:hypothetical protein
MRHKEHPLTFIRRRGLECDADHAYLHERRDPDVAGGKAVREDDSRLDRGMTKHPPPVGPGIAPKPLQATLLFPSSVSPTDASNESFELSIRDWIRIILLLRPSLLWRNVAADLRPLSC